jgi:hypothetical protein
LAIKAREWGFADLLFEMIRLEIKANSAWSIDSLAESLLPARGSQEVKIKAPQQLRRSGLSVPKLEPNSVQVLKGGFAARTLLRKIHRFF